MLYYYYKDLDTPKGKGEIMKIATLIEALKVVQAKSGNKDVLISSDPEGNNYCSLGNILSHDLHEGKILIFPESSMPACEIGL